MLLKDALLIAATEFPFQIAEAKHEAAAKK
jgi:hypothetical protein